MTLEFFQYQVKQQWYRLYWGVMLACGVLYVTAYIAIRLIPSTESFLGILPLNVTGLIIVGISLAYLLIGYWFVARYSVPFATLAGSMLFSLVLLNGLTMTAQGVGVLIYILIWMFSAFFIGMYGLPLVSGSVFLTYIYVLLQSQFQPGNIPLASWLLVIGTTVLGVISYFFWKTRFQSIEEKKVNQLSGMLRSNMQQSEILIESIIDGIIVTDTAGKITLMNPAAAKMTEWQVNEALGVDARLVVKLAKEDGSDIPEEHDPFTLVFSQKQHTNQILLLEGREGHKEVISLTVSPILLQGDTAPKGAVAVIRDVSEERANEKQRGEFISTASHEMRTPVAAIEGYLALALNDKVSAIDSRARGFLEKAHSSTEHLGKLFQDLLTSSKAEDGRLTSHPSVVEMGAFMQQLSDDLKFAAEKKGLVAEFVIGGADETIDATTKDASSQHVVKPFYYTYVDPDRMREVITNLFDNACKYTDSGKVSIGLTGDTEVVQVYIRDTGAGIPAEDIPHLFQKFYRVDNSATRTIGGTGLGLFISRKIVEMYQGRIWLESEVGKGSTFFINLPRLSSTRAAELQSAETAAFANAVPPTTPRTADKT